MIRSILVLSAFLFATCLGSDRVQAESRALTGALRLMKEDRRVACRSRISKKNDIVRVIVRGSKLKAKPLTGKAYRKLITKEIRAIAKRLFKVRAERVAELGQRLVEKRTALKAFRAFVAACSSFVASSCTVVSAEGICEAEVPSTDGAGTPTPTGTPTSGGGTPTPNPTPTITPTPTPQPAAFEVALTCPLSSPYCKQGQLLKTESADLPADANGVIARSALQWNEALLVRNDIEVGAQLQVTPSSGTAIECSLDGSALQDCEIGLVLPAMVRGVHQLMIRGQKGASVVTRQILVVGLPLAPTGFEFPGTYGARYSLRNGVAARVSQEPDYVSVAAGSALYMQGRNFCIHRTASDSCSLVMAQDSSLVISGSNVAVSTEPAYIYLSANSYTSITGSNFFPQELHIAPGAVVFSSSNFSPRVIKLLSSSVDDVTTCPYFRDGSCPNDLQILQ